MGVAITTDGKRVYVANVFSNNASVIDTVTNTVATVAVELNPFEVAVTPEGEHAYNTATNTVAPTVPVGDDPQGSPSHGTGNT